MCEDNDSDCRFCGGHCTRDSSVTLVRVDMVDVTGTAFCIYCSEDALESGLFNVVGD